MRFRLPAALALSLSLVLPACDQVEDDRNIKAGPPAKAQPAPKAEKAAEPKKAEKTEKAAEPKKAETAKKTEKAARRGKHGAFPMPQATLTEDELSTYWRVMEKAVTGDFEAYKAEKAKVKGWQALEIRVGRGLLQYHAMKKAGVDTGITGNDAILYDRYIALLEKAKQAQKK